MDIEYRSREVLYSTLYTLNLQALQGKANTNAKTTFVCVFLNDDNSIGVPHIITAKNLPILYQSKALPSN